MKTIVVPTDFSQDSLNALNMSVNIARKTGATIKLIHVNKTRNFLSFVRSNPEEDPETIRHDFEDLISHVNHDGVTMDYVIKNGSVVKEICHYAEKEDAYLIIMGTHGASGFREFWAGSNAYHIVTHSDCPVLTVRGTYHEENIKKIVLPIDSSMYTREKVPYTGEFAKMIGAEVHVCGMYLEDFSEIRGHVAAYSSQAAEYIAMMGVETYEHSLEGDNPAKLALDFAQQNNAELISIMTEQVTSLSNTILGPYAQQMVNHSPIPILTMHHNMDLDSNFSIM